MIGFKRFLHSFFIPSEQNNFRSNALHLNFLTYYLIAALMISFFYKPLSSVGRQVLGIATDMSIPRLLELTNAERQKNGLPALTYNDQLASAASAKAQNMFAHNYWAHYGPDGTSPWDFILGSGYRYQYAGENLAKDFMNSDEVVAAWMNSPTHRANIVKPEYKEIGFGVMNGQIDGEDTTLVVQMFGSPISGVVANANPQAAAPEPTAIPTLQPTLAPKPQVLSENNNADNDIVINKKKTPKPVNWDTLPIKISMIFFSILLMALVFDMYYSHKIQIVRVTGKNMAHIIFLSFIIVALTFLAKGSIL
jgi:hypothetical protein